MPGGLDQTMANAIMVALAKNSATATLGTVTITGPQKMRLMTANGSDTAAGTELGTSGGYTAGGLAMTLTTPAAATFNNSAAVSWSAMPSSTLTGPEQWDSSGTPLRSFWAPWAAGNIVVGAGNTFTVPATTGYVPSLV